MNIFKNMLFLHGFLTDPRDADGDEGPSYAQGYGNHVASEKAFGRLGHGHANPHAAAAPAAFANDLCSTGGCG